VASAAGDAMRGKIWIIVAVLLAVIAAAWGLDYYTSRYDYIISQAAARNELDFFLVKSLVYEESWFRPEVRGAAGEIGLMQITKAAASDFAVQKGFPPLREEQLMDPGLNVEIGCWYLRRSLDRYRKTPHPELFALLRYNAGETRADNWLKIALNTPPPAGMSKENFYLSVVDFPKTRAYAQRILKRFRSRNFWF